MTLTLNTENDYLFMVNREPVTLYDATGNSQGIVKDCIRLGGSKPERWPSNGKYLERKVSWRLPYPNVSADIMPGFSITDNTGVTFVVLSVTRPDNWNDAWKCHTNSLLFQLALEDTVQYLQASGTASPTGARNVTDTPIGSPVAAAIESERQSIGDQWAMKNMSETFLIYLDADPSGTDGPSIIAAGDLLQDQNSIQYEIQDVFTRERLDEKITLRCVKKL